MADVLSVPSADRWEPDSYLHQDMRHKPLSYCSLHVSPHTFCYLRLEANIKHPFTLNQKSPTPLQEDRGWPRISDQNYEHDWDQMNVLFEHRLNLVKNTEVGKKKAAYQFSRVSDIDNVSTIPRRPVTVQTNNLWAKSAINSIRWRMVCSCFSQKWLCSHSWMKRYKQKRGNVY